MSNKRVSKSTSPRKKKKSTTQTISKKKFRTTKFSSLSKPQKKIIKYLLENPKVEIKYFSSWFSKSYYGSIEGYTGKYTVATFNALRKFFTQTDKDSDKWRTITYFKFDREALDMNDVKKPSPKKTEKVVDEDFDDSYLFKE